MFTALCAINPQYFLLAQVQYREDVCSKSCHTAVSCMSLNLCTSLPPSNLISVFLKVLRLEQCFFIVSKRNAELKCIIYFSLLCLYVSILLYVFMFLLPCCDIKLIEIYVTKVKILSLKEDFDSALLADIHSKQYLNDKN